MPSSKQIERILTVEAVGASEKSTLADATYNRHWLWNGIKTYVV